MNSLIDHNGDNNNNSNDNNNRSYSGIMIINIISIVYRYILIGNRYISNNNTNSNNQHKNTDTCMNNIYI